MRKIIPEPRIRAQNSYSRLVTPHMRKLQEKVIIRELFEMLGDGIRNNFSEEAIDIEYTSFSPVDNQRTHRKEIELWVFTPESLLLLVEACADENDTASLDIGAQLRRIIRQKSLLKNHEDGESEN